MGARARAGADRRGGRPLRVRASRRRDGRRCGRQHRAVRLTRALDVVRTLIAAILEQKVVGMEARRAWRRMTLAVERTGAGRGRPHASPRPRDAGRASVLPVPPVGGGATPRGGGASRVCAGGVARGARRRAVRRGSAPARGDAGDRPVDVGRGHAAVVRRSRRGLGRRLPPPGHRRRGRSPASRAPPTSGCWSCWSRTEGSEAASSGSSKRATSPRPRTGRGWKPARSRSSSSPLAAERRRGRPRPSRRRRAPASRPAAA